MKKLLLLAVVITLSSFIFKEKEKPTLFIIGDSTVKNGSGKGADALWGWGNFISNYIDTARMRVSNEALGGTSTRTFMYRGRWDAVYPKIKKGDYVLMQFGHNDGGPLDDTARARGTIKGNGPESKEIYNPITRQKETVYTYGWYLKKFVKEIHAKGAKAVICSPIPRNNWADGKIKRAAGDYGLWARQAAEESGASFLDLNTLVADIYDERGAAVVGGQYFTSKDHTHTSKEGAELNAEMVVKGIQQLKDRSLRKFLRQE